MTDVLVITGAPGVGESTVARQLAAQLPLCAYVGADVLQRMIVSVGEWPATGSATALRQLRLRTANSAMLASSFVADRIPAIVDDVIGLPEQRHALDSALTDWAVTVVGLTAPGDVIAARDAGRHKHTAAAYYGVEAGIRTVIEATWIDSGHQSVAETVAAVRHVAEW